MMARITVDRLIAYLEASGFVVMRRLPDPWTMAREAISGGMMAIGAVLIPGGNDALLVYGLPSGSPHAIVSYIIILTLLALLLWSVGRVRRWLVWPMP